MRRVRLWVLILGLLATRGASAVDVDPSTLTGKVLCGYQGWFNTPADGAGRGWVHWGRGAMRPGTATVDLWPDLSDLTPDERFATGFQLPGGRPAEVFSSYVPATVMRHFRWMRDYGIDGVLLQRFASGVGVPAVLKQYDQVVANVRAGAAANGRVYGLMYDLSGLHDDAVDQVIADWKHLADTTHLTADKAYVHHAGKPVVALWGIGFGDGRDPLLGGGGLRLVRFLTSDPTYGGNRVMLGLPTGWRAGGGDAVADPRLLDVVAAADVVSPWTVGRYRTPAEVDRHAAKFWKPDADWCRGHGKAYMPVVFPGFSWHNLQGVHGKSSPVGQIPRLGGRFLWSQYVAARAAGATMVYQAMFDEVDEGTAIFKCANAVPDGQGKSAFLGYDGLPSDFYLRLAGEGTRLVRGEITAADETLIGGK